MIRQQPDVDVELQDVQLIVSALSDFIADCICCSESDKDYEYAASMIDEILHFDTKKFLITLGSIVSEYQETAELFEVNSGDPYLMEAIAEHAKVVLAEKI